MSATLQPAPAGTDDLAATMPAIAYSEYACSTWVETVNGMSGWNATLTLADGSLRHVKLHGAGANPHTHMAGVWATTTDRHGDLVPGARPVFYDAEGITRIYID